MVPGRTMSSRSHRRACTRVVLKPPQRTAVFPAEHGDNGGSLLLPRETRDPRPFSATAPRPSSPARPGPAPLPCAGTMRAGPALWQPGHGRREGAAVAGGRAQEPGGPSPPPPRSPSHGPASSPLPSAAAPAPAQARRRPHLVELSLGGFAQRRVHGAPQGLDDAAGVHGAGSAGGGGQGPGPRRAHMDPPPPAAAGAKGRESAESPDRAAPAADGSDAPSAARPAPPGRGAPREMQSGTPAPGRCARVRPGTDTRGEMIGVRPGTDTRGDAGYAVPACTSRLRSSAPLEEPRHGSRGPAPPAALLGRANVVRGSLS